MAGQAPASHRWRAGIAAAGMGKAKIAGMGKAGIATAAGMGKKPLKLKESNWRGESSKKEEEGEGLKQVERVKWNVWRNFLIAAAASEREK